MLRTTPLRVLTDGDLGAALGLLDQDVVANVFVRSRVDAGGLDSWRLGAEVWGYLPDGRLAALCYSGANLVPVGAAPEAVRAFADRARRQGRRCSSIFGLAEMVGPLWRLLAPDWGPAREVRDCQPLMSISNRPQVAADPAVRRVRPDEVDILLPACVAMFTEEVGVSPVAVDGGSLYRARVVELISQGRAFARIEDGQVLFKAEIGAVTRAACQVQGVWVAPQHRGHGLGTAGMAAVVAAAQQAFAPIVSLYVNDFNEPARQAYEHVGFTEVGRFMSVLF
jgi:predicted GNAT family acetyltransferase